MNLQTKVAVSIDHNLLEQLDSLVNNKIFPSRGKAIEEAVRKMVYSVQHTILERECRKLNIEEERALAEEGLSRGNDLWPEY